ncbi:MAG: PAS domain S-box protein [Chloroflexi bacterium]|nr:PAS domain S-box protein [Chloroflexota bacterium]
MYSIKIKLTLIYGALSLAGLLLMLLIFYSATSASVYQGAEARAEVLSDEFEYAVEIMAAEDDLFSMQRLVEKSSLLEDVIQIIVIDTQNKILAHTNNRLIGQSLSFSSPMINEAIRKREKISQTSDGRVIFVTPLHGQVFTNEFHDVIGTLWVEIDITPTIALTQRLFLGVTLAAVAIFLMFFFGYYLTVKSIIIDRLHDVETGIAHHLQGGSLPSAIMIKKSFGSEDEINTLAQTYNYLITSLQDSQKKLQAERDFALLVMEGMREGLTITDANEHFEYVNPAYANLLGLSPGQIIGRTPGDVTHPEDLDKSAEEQELRKGGKSSSYELRLLASDGTEINVLISSAPRFQDEKYAGSISVITNISQRARLEQMKSDFINRASHELRTPLSTAILMAELLESGTAKEKQQFLTTLKEQLNRQRLLLNDLLVAGRIENKRFEVHLSPIDILPIIEEAISSVKLQADARQITIQLEMDESLPLVNTERQSLIQVLLNLLSNAIKFSNPQGGILVKIYKEGQFVAIAVQDHGIGIPAQDLPHIATRFYRSQNATQMEIQGTGIGLYIVNEIMQSLHGRMKIDSIEKQGTTVTIFLPLEPDGDPGAPA